MVFLSYSREDATAARELAAVLATAGSPVHLGRDLRGGEAGWNEILAAIRACDVFVLALSDNSIGSRLCRAELAYAQELGLPLLPVRVGPVRRPLPAPITESQVVDWSTGDDAHRRALLAAVAEAARTRSELPEPLPPPPPVPRSDVAHPPAAGRATMTEAAVRSEPPEDEGGDPACWLRRVCPACGRLADQDPPTVCAACGAELLPD